MGMWQAYWQMLAGTRPLALGGGLLIALGGGLEALALVLLIPVLGSALGDDPGSFQQVRAMLGEGEGALLSGLVLFALFGGLSTLCKLAAEACILKVRNRVEQEAGIGMADALLEVKWEPFASMRQGDIAKALLMEGNQMAFGVRQFLTGIGMALTVLPLIVSAALVSLSMTGYTLAFGGLAALLFYAAARPVRRHVRRLSDALSAISLRIADAFGNLKFFRSTGLVSAARKETEVAYAEYTRAYFDSQIYPAVLRYGVEAGALVFIAGFLYWQLAFLHNSPSVVLVFLAIFYRLVPKIVATQDFLFQATTFTPWYESWKKRKAFCDAHRRDVSGSLLPLFGNGLTFKHVSFAYANTATVLEDVSFSLAPGSCVAVVGSSGSGKTTLLDLVSGLLQPVDGELVLGGKSLPEIDIEAWQQRIGLVSQDCPVFFASVLENIAWGSASPDRALAERCARQAHAWEFIERLPQGIHSLIGERGCNLSGGQRQRLGIARALYRQPWLLILDEATSALDRDSEKAVQDALADLKGTMAILLVAHRLQTVAMADQIIVLDEGKIVEAGSWDQLLSLRGKFHAMVNGQTKASYGQPDS